MMHSFKPEPCQGRLWVTTVSKACRPSAWHIVGPQQPLAQCSMDSFCLIDRGSGCSEEVREGRSGGGRRQQERQRHRERSTPPGDHPSTLLCGLVRQHPQDKKTLENFSCGSSPQEGNDLSVRKAQNSFTDSSMPFQGPVTHAYCLGNRQPGP